jgi:FixJ family two-component response regulator
MDCPAPRLAVLDDEPRFRQALGRLLRSHGFEVVPFEQAAALLEAVARQRFDCLLLDLHMPEMTGFNVLAALAERGPDLPVLVITGKGSPDSRQRVQALGAAGYLEKPIDERTLLEAIQSAMTGGSTGMKSVLCARL